jgi:hypothetical protein
MADHRSATVVLAVGGMMNMWVSAPAARCLDGNELKKTCSANSSSVTPEASRRKEIQMTNMNDPNLNPNSNGNVAVWTALTVCAALAIGGLIYSNSRDNQTASAPDATQGQSTTGSGSSGTSRMAPGPPEEPPR